MPCHVAQRRVHDQREEHHEQDVGAEAHPTSHASRDECGGDDGEFELKQREEQEGNRPCKRLVGAQSHPAKREERQGVAHDATQAVPEAQAEAHKHPQDADYAKRHKALKHGGNDVLAMHHAPVKEGQTRGHQQHKRAGHHHPRGVSRVNGLQICLFVRRTQKPNGWHQQRQRQKVALSAHEIKK